MAWRRMRGVASCLRLVGVLRSVRRSHPPGPRSGSGGTWPEAALHARGRSFRPHGVLTSAGRALVLSCTSTLDVEDPCRIQRGSVHAAPPGREVPTGAGVEQQVVPGGDVMEWFSGEAGLVRAHPVDGGIAEARR